ncbi:MAG: phospholipase D-like domain-containing protein, partial [Bacilli bacterium]
VPGKPDKFWVNQATKSYYEVLLQKGVEIYEYTNIFVHSKVLIIDDKIASVGSVNFDPRSFNINFEATVLIENNSVKDLVKDFSGDLQKSKRIELAKWRKRSLINKIFQGFANLFTPLL